MLMVRFIFCVVLIWSGVAYSAVRLPSLWTQSYPSIHTLEYGKLTRFWAQEGIGMPEAHAFMAEIAQGGFSFSTPTIGVMDSGFKLDRVLAGVRIEGTLAESLLALSETWNDDHIAIAHTFRQPLQNFLLRKFRRRRVLIKHMIHGTAVAHLIAGKSPIGVSLRGEIGLLLPVPRRMKLSERVEFHELVAEIPLPRLMNHSQALAAHDDERSRQIAVPVRKIVEKTVFVSAAGNLHPEPIEAGKRMLAEQMVIVGSSDPTGYRSVFSSTGDEEAIRAFGDYYLQTFALEPDTYHKFGGTSGATPLVTGALADVLSIAPSLQRAELKLLLKHTSIPNAYGDRAGMLNYYKLLRVAERLRERDKTLQVLQDVELYDFGAEADTLRQEAIATVSLEERFRKLRKAFFLDHHNREVRVLLADIYRRAGYEAQAFFYDNSDQEGRDTFTAQKISVQEVAVEKFIAALGEADIETMTQLLGKFSNDYFLARFAKIADALRGLTPAEQETVADFLRQHKIADVQIDQDGTINMGKVKS